MTRYTYFICRGARYVVFLCLGFLSCTKWTTVPAPNTEVTGGGAFSNDNSADATVTGLYSQVMTGTLDFLNGGTTLYPALSADELYATSPNASADPFTQNALSPRSFVVGNDLWGKAYNYLYQENACLAGLDGNAAISETVKERLEGETKFMRALTLFYLTNLYGAVPLPMTTDYLFTATLPRVDTATVYRQILADLTEGEKQLHASGAESNELRPSRNACATLLARVYLYQRDWMNAALEADSVINSGLYSLAAPDAVFLAGSRETIFALSPVIPYTNTAEGQTFIPYDPTVLPLYALQAPILAAFESRDLRRANWLDSTGIAGVTYYYPYKYKVSFNSNILEHNIVLRFAELYLIRAEARTELQNLPGAREDVNVIRTRAGLPPLAEGLLQADLLTYIAHENQTEFFAEWGHRWLDLKRTGTANTILGKEKGGWQPTAALYPVPYNEILLNRALTQNKGY